MQNLVIIAGNVGAAPETRTTQGGTKIAQFSLATSRPKRDGRITAKPTSDRGVAIVVKTRADATGYDPEQVSGHSLRAGFLTEAEQSGASIFKMRYQSRHKSLEVLSDYVRDSELLDDHAGTELL